MPFRVKTTAETYWGIRTRIGGQETFAYTRYGDGELEVMLGGGGGNQLPNPKLTEETWELFHREDPRNLIGLARHAPEPGMEPGLFDAWMDPKYKFAELPHEFEHAVALHYYAVFKPNMLGNFMYAMRGRPKLYVGALNDPALADIWGEYTHVAVPEYNAYDTIDEWQAVIETLLPTHPIVLYAAGPAKCASVLRLLKSGAHFQAIDLGSVVDYVLGVPSRTWIKKGWEMQP